MFEFRHIQTSKKKIIEKVVGTFGFFFNFCTLNFKFYSKLIFFIGSLQFALGIDISHIKQWNLNKINPRLKINRKGWHQV